CLQLLLDPRQRLGHFLEVPEVGFRFIGSPFEGGNPPLVVRELGQFRLQVAPQERHQRGEQNEAGGDDEGGQGRSRRAERGEPSWRIGERWDLHGGALPHQSMDGIRGVPGRAGGSGRAVKRPRQDRTAREMARADRFRFLKRRIGAASDVRGEIGCSLGYTSATPRSSLLGRIGRAPNRRGAATSVWEGGRERCAFPRRTYAVARMRFSGTTPAATRTD